LGDRHAKRQEKAKRADEISRGVEDDDEDVEDEFIL
jgi:hypothetical protein